MKPYLRRMAYLPGVVCFWILLTTTVLAQSTLEDEMYAIARELWCPLCAGIRLDACELQACIQMREEIIVLLQEGYNATYIIQYFEEQYGHQVLGEPPRTGFYSLAWIVPIGVMVALGVVLGTRMRRAARSRSPDIPPVATP